MNTGFQYVKIPYGEDILAVLGSESMEVHKEKQHFHNLMEIAVCRMGSGELMIGEKKYTYQQGDVVVIPRNVSHMILADTEEKGFWEYIYVKPNLFLEKIYKTETRKRVWLMEEVEARAFLASRKDAPSLFTEINLIMDQYRRREYEYRKSVSGLLFALFIEILRINHKEYQKPKFSNKLSPQKVEILGRAMEYIEENFAQDLRMEDIAQAAFVSKTCLRRMFAEYCEISPMHYAKMIRIEKACELLENRDININQAAFKVGYTNISTFINNFKQITGKTPKQWRQDTKQKK